MKNKINIILLAAGNSRRFGSNKLLTEFRGKLLYKHTLDKIVEIEKWLKIIKVDSNIVMVSQYDEILSETEMLRYKPVKNSKPELGISYSIKLGLEACGTADNQSIKFVDDDYNVKSYMFFVFDQPLLRIESIKNLIEDYLKSDKTIGCLRYKDNLGNPCIFDRKYVQDLFNLEGDAGGKKIILLNRDSTLTVESYDEKELCDIDNIVDFNILINGLK